MFICLPNSIWWQAADAACSGLLVLVLLLRREPPLSLAKPQGVALVIGLEALRGMQGWGALELIEPCGVDLQVSKGHRRLNPPASLVAPLTPPLPLPPAELGS